MIDRRVDRLTEKDRDPKVGQPSAGTAIAGVRDSRDHPTHAVNHPRYECNDRVVGRSKASGGNLTAGAAPHHDREVNTAARAGAANDVIPGHDEVK